MKKILIWFIQLNCVLLFTTGCGSKEKEMSSTFPELNGKYSFKEERKWGMIFEMTSVSTWEFDDTRVAKQTICEWGYDETGWVNPDKVEQSFNIEWKVEDGKFFKRPWGIEETDWEEAPFQFISKDGVRLNGKLHVRVFREEPEEEKKRFK